MADEPFLSRWSKRKTEARAGTPPPVEPVPEPAPPAPVPAPEAASVPAEPLPPVESLTMESDYTGFMKPEIGEDLKRGALKALFKDPHFNVMDGLDIYISDYSQPDPLPPEWLSQLKQMKRLGAYEEKVEEVPEPAREVAEASSEAATEAVAESEQASLEPTGKTLPEQGLVEAPSRDSSHTVDGVTPPPGVPE